MPNLPDGSVPFGSVIKVLKVLAEAGTFTIKVDGSTVTMVKDGSPEVTVLTDPVGRRMVQRFAHKYCDGKTEYFYHPDMLVGGNGEKH